MLLGLLDQKKFSIILIIMLISGPTFLISSNKDYSFLPEAEAQISTIFSDNFDYEDSIENHGWIIDGHNPHTVVDPDPDYENDRAVHLLSQANSNGSPQFSRTFEDLYLEPGMEVSIGFYDTSENCNNCDVHIYVFFDDGSKYIEVGWYNSQNHFEYQYTWSDGWSGHQYEPFGLRSLGWHTIKWNITDEYGVNLYIDDHPVFENLMIGGNPVEKLAKFYVATGGDPYTYSLYVDDFMVTSGHISVNDSDGDGIPDSEDPDDDNDGYNDWMEELIGTSLIDENDFPSLDEIEHNAVLKVIELNLTDDQGKQQSLIKKIEKITDNSKSKDASKDANNAVIKTKTLLNNLYGIFKDGELSLDEYIQLSSLVMKLVPTQEGDGYNFIINPGTIEHEFYFNKAQLEEMRQSCFKAQPYANWAVDKIWTLTDGMGSSLGKIIAQGWLACRWSSLADNVLDDGGNGMWVYLESRSDEDGLWGLTFVDKVANVWKTIIGWVGI